MEVVRLVEEKVLSVTEKILGVLGGGSDYLSFEAQLEPRGRFSWFLLINQAVFKAYQPG